MTRLVEQLERLLTDRGWEVSERLTDLDWWIDEQWTITSTWSPVGMTLIISFLVDPMSSGQRKPGTEIWAISASREPLRRGEVDESAIETQYKEKYLREFVDGVCALR